MRHLGVPKRALSLVAAAAILAGGAAAARAQSETRRIGTLAPAGSSWMKTLRKAAQVIAKHTHGRVTTKYYPGGAQGDERDMVRKMKLGQLDGAALTSVGLSLIDENIRVLELPMMFKNTGELDYVRSKMWPYFQKQFARKGFILGDPGDVGFVYFYSNTPVRSLSDLRRSKVWMWTDDRIVRAMYKKLGINGVPLGVPDVLPALQTGRINACYSSPLAAVALQWYTKVKYTTSMPMSYAIGADVFRKQVYTKARPSDRRVMNKVEHILGHKLLHNVRRDNRRAFRAITASGVQVINTPPSLVRQFRTAAQQVWHQLAGDVYTRRELRMVLKYRAEYRAMHKR